MSDCAVPGCERGGKLRRGWCGTHYSRWWKTGEPGPAESLKQPHVIEHGTYNEYHNYGCRCDACRVAAVEYQRQASAASCIDCGAPVWGRFPSRVGNGRCRACDVERRTTSLDELHGTETGYSRGCKCAECRAAASAARRRRRLANAEHDREYQRAYRDRRRAAGAGPKARRSHRQETEQSALPS